MITALILGLCPFVVHALDNGVGRTPVMGFNSYMSPFRNEAGLSKIADFLITTGLQPKGYRYLNTDEGWELATRNSTTGELQWDPKEYPSGLPTFIETTLHARNLSFGIYGAASGVTCGNNPGNLYHEVKDAKTYASWGVDFVKSDNCASYALDPSVRFAALRDALNATGRPMVFSIEPFSIDADPAMSRDVSHMWRIGCDISGKYETVMERADLSDKWSPLAGPGGFNDPDMLNLNEKLTLGENRLYFGLWAIMKAPLLLSIDYTKLSSEVLDMIGNEEVIAVNQDSLSIQARKLQVDGAPLPWLVGLEDCASVRAGTSGRYFGRRWDTVAGGGVPGSDTRVWRAVASAGSNNTGIIASTTAPQYSLENIATGRCLEVFPATTRLNATVVLLPCTKSPTQLWTFDVGISTVTSVSNVATGQALAISNTTLYGTVHGADSFSVSDVAYGQGGLALLDQAYVQDGCSSRDCQNYDPSQMWYFESGTGLLRHSLYRASINHRPAGTAGYTLTPKVPTSRHNCLAHVLSVGNFGTEAGKDTEVWGGPLAGGDFVVALVNRGSVNATVTADLSLLGEASAQVEDVATQSFKVRDLWEQKDAGTTRSTLSASVPVHDIKLFRLTPE